MATRTNNLKELNKRRDRVKKSVTEIHDSVLKNTDNLVSVSIQTGKKWQKIMDKAVKNSEPLMAKQVDMVFDTLETLKDQFSTGRTRMSKLIGIDTREIKEASKKVVKKARKIAANPKQAVEETIETISDMVDGKESVQDLKVIDGIGPKMETVLNEAGIRNYEDLASTTVPKLKKILLEADTRYRLMDPAPWKAAAAKLK